MRRPRRMGQLFEGAGSICCDAASQLQKFFARNRDLKHLGSTSQQNGCRSYNDRIILACAANEPYCIFAQRGGPRMKSQSGISYDNAAVASCPKHLLQFAVDQRYDDYTSVDHAVWRFIMRQNIFFLKEYAHKVYFQCLLNTGISFERIPRIQDMNDSI